jgi:hypothetical protein
MATGMASGLPITDQEIATSRCAQAARARGQQLIRDLIACTLNPL